VLGAGAWARVRTLAGGFFATGPLAFAVVFALAVVFAFAVVFALAVVFAAGFLAAGFLAAVVVFAVAVRFDAAAVFFVAAVVLAASDFWTARGCFAADAGFFAADVGFFAADAGFLARGAGLSAAASAALVATARFSLRRWGRLEGNDPITPGGRSSLMAAMIAHLDSHVKRPSHPRTRGGRGAGIRSPSAVGGKRAAPLKRPRGFEV
jgi:hypothetical protein